LEAQEVLRERQIFSFPATDIQEIVSVYPDKKITLQRLREEQWKIFSSTGDERDDAPVENVKIQDLLDNVVHVTIEKFVHNTPDVVDLERWGLDENCPRRLQVKTHRQTAELLYSEREGQIYAKLSTDPCVFQLHPRYKPYLQIDFDDYARKRLWDWDPGERLQVLSVFLGDRCLWRYDTQSSASDESIGTFFVNHASDWVVRAYVDDLSSWPLDREEGPWPYTLTLQTSDGTVERNYEVRMSERLGASVQVGRYEGRLFYLAQDWIDTLFELGEKTDWQRAAATLNSKL
jgi:hypothetical protein